MKVPFFDLSEQYRKIRGEVAQAIQAVLESGAYASGPFVETFERDFAKKHGAEHCVAVNSGTAALHAALWGLGIQAGDEVLVPSNTFIASAAAVVLAGATPVFVDCEKYYYNIDPQKIEKAITKNTRALMVVHLYGQPAHLGLLKALADKHGLFLIEDCAQAHNASYNGKPVGTFGAAGCFSFYPSKNLGAYGEGGAVITNDANLCERLRMIRDHGSNRKYYHQIIGHNYRMHGIQGSVLSVKLAYLDQWTEARRCIANLYYQALGDCCEIVLPEEMPETKHVYHLFVVRSKQRNALSEYLKQQGIGTAIHYPIPCHRQECFSSLGYTDGSFPCSELAAEEILSLPMYPEITAAQIALTSEKIRDFFHA